VAATEYDQMLKEAAVLKAIAPNVTIKVPLTQDGLKACYALSQEGTMVNVTLCFSAAQALLAAKAGATFISPFVGRLDDIGQNGMDLIADIVQIYANYPAIKTEVLVASIRNPIHLIEAAKMGADVATIPPNVIKQLYNHPLTNSGLAAFLSDWAKTGQNIA
jgi:transaldolase